MDWDTGAVVTPESTVKYLLKVIDAEIIEYTQQQELLFGELTRVEKHLDLLRAKRKAAAAAHVIVRGEAR